MNTEDKQPQQNVFMQMLEDYEDKPGIYQVLVIAAAVFVGVFLTIIFGPSPIGIAIACSFGIVVLGLVGIGLNY